MAMLQLVLDLFGVAPAAPAFEPKAPPALEEQAPAAPQLIADEPAVALGDALMPAHFAHPRANRAIDFAHARVHYEFQRGQRRTIGFSVGPDGLAVRAPRWTPLHEVEAALREKERWIVAKLGEARERHARIESNRIDWKEGATLPFLGQPVTLVLDPRQQHGRGGAVLAEGDGAGVLHIGLPHTATPEQLRDVAQAWLMRQARRVFIARLDHFAPQLDVRWQKLSLSSAGTRWGSASADGSIRLNWRLIHFREPIIDYVVVHEL
ncbi:MAG: M48 family metallopeptidase, partial [Ottowia sp.]|nr:M48 family metallopeptidase [Ottowia sp.]